MNLAQILFSALAIALSATGCTVGPDYHTPKTAVPAEWSEPREGGTTSRAVELMRWWTVFADPTLDALVELAYQSNHDLRMAEARVRQARAQQDFSQADIWPTFNTSASYAQQLMSKNQPLLSSLPGNIGIALDNNVYQAGFDASWEIDVFGGRRRALEGAAADLAASVEARQDVLVSLLAEVARNYVELRALQQQLAIARSNIQLQKEAVDLTRQRLKAGLTSELDVTQAQALLANTNSQVPGLEGQLRQAMHRLATLSGREPGALVGMLSPAGAIPPTPPEVPLGLPADLLRRRPDIRRAERQLAAETARIGVQVAELFPKFSLNGNFGLESVSMVSFLNGDSMLGSIGPTVRWRIFDAGRVRANIRAQTARQDEALAAYEKAVLTALEDVENALVAYAKEKIRYRAVQEEAAQDQRSLDLATALYIQGRVNYLNVLDAQRSLYQVQDQLVQSRQNVSQNLVALYKALGGGWEDSPPSAASRPGPNPPDDRTIPQALPDVAESKVSQRTTP